MNRSMDFSNYLDNLWSGIRETPAAIVVNSRHPEPISTAVAAFASKLDAPAICFHCAAAETMLCQPYYPITPLISSLLADTDEAGRKKLFEQAGVYHYQRDTISGYFRDGKASRREEIIFEELHYEQQRMRENLSAVLNRSAGKRNVILVIENIHWYTASSLEIITSLLESRVDFKLMLVFTLDQNYLFRDSERERSWDAFFSFLNRKYSLLDYDTADFTIAATSRAVTHTVTIAPLAADYHRSMLDGHAATLLNAAENAFHFMAFYECREYCSALNDGMIKHNTALPEPDWIRMMTLLGDACRLLNDRDTALVHYNSLYTRLQKNQNYGEICSVYRKMADIYWRKDNKEIAQKLSSQSIRLAAKHGTNEQKAMAYIGNLQVETDLIIFHEQFNSKYREFCEDLIQLLKKARFENHLSFLCTSGTYLLSLLHNGHGETGFRLCREGIRIAGKNNNLFRLAQATHIEGMLFQDVDDWTSALDSYKRAQDLRIQLRDYIELARSCNGIGYFYFSMENYMEAHSYYTKALQYLTQAENPEYVEIGATLFNIALLYYYTFKYAETIDLLEKLLAMMSALHVENLPYVPLFDIYSVLGISYLMSGNRIKAFEYIKKIANLPAIQNPSYRSEYFGYFTALFRYDSAHPAASNRQFRAAIDTVRSSNRIFDFLLMQIYYTFGSILQTQGRQKEVAALVNEALTGSAEKRHPYHYSLLRSLLNRLEIPVPTFPFPPLEFNFKAIMQEIVHIQDMNKLYKRMEEINFLNNLQAILAKGGDTEPLLREVCELITTAFNTDVTAVYLAETDSAALPRIVYTDGTSEQDRETVGAMASILAGTGTEQLYSGLDDGILSAYHDMFTSVLHIPFYQVYRFTGSLICCSRIREHSLTGNDQRILSIAAQQIGAVIERMHMDRIIMEKNAELEQANAKLRKAAITDGLTELLNKDQLLRRLDDELKRARRYHDRQVGSFSVIFIDLDNFKYYNDSFGHNIGDIVLKRFAELLRRNSRDVDSVFRFGGDEFVILLSQTGVEGAKVVINRIFRDLRQCRHFIPDIESRLEASVSIPPDKLLGCSIGVTEYDYQANKGIDEILEEADRALYAAKKNGKNRFIAYHPEL